MKFPFSLFGIFGILVFQVKGDWTCLHLACRYGHRDIVGELIVKYKCDKEKVKKVYNVIVELCILNIMHTLVMNRYCVCHWKQTVPFSKNIRSGFTSSADLLDIH